MDTQAYISMPVLTPTIAPPGLGVHIPAKGPVEEEPRKRSVQSLESSPGQRVQEVSESGAPQRDPEGRLGNPCGD